MSSGTTEIAWFKSSYSGTQGDDCIEIAITERAVFVRDSKDASRKSFAVSREGWASFARFATDK
ncbi:MULTISPECIES: DUF397 domain-containing protein [unclassified Streptomyces]|uniref:DUF397 domain-containing protein n=1 Tax=unclassified Streptomyces TaxID=2593676 RepID=UPI0019035A81|nr:MULTISPECIES: DUF397 domain-containing protein [unclassified Streptomyces]MCU4746512.1 DUF397 domain-containing protein [Streptomyces sp. G-5]QQN76780.1 DUF397 domain-containing protein [Streptomyces sp. XC 2026]